MFTPLTLSRQRGGQLVVGRGHRRATGEGDHDGALQAGASPFMRGHTPVSENTLYVGFVYASLQGFEAISCFPHELATRVGDQAALRVCINLRRSLLLQ